MQNNWWWQLIEKNFIYIWVLSISLWAGTANTIRKVKEGKIEQFSISEWVGDMVISGFIGFMTYYLCLYAKVPEPLTAVFIGISSHMGVKALVLFEKTAGSKICKFFDKWK